MLESIKNNIFNYTKLTEEEQQKRGILGRLTGIIADTQNPTRNGRKYSAELREKVFENPIMQEKITNRCCFGELGHPLDGRSEIDMEKAAICLAETPKVGKDGNLYGVFDILSTPNGKILKSLCDYGCTIGVSSRGQGSIIQDYDGNEEVDPDDYDCECWDAVLVPAVETARMKYVTESLDKTDKNGLKLKQALTESLQKASDEDKKVMSESLKNLGIDITKSDENIDREENKEAENEPATAENNGVNEVIISLQSSLKENLKLKAQIKSLQEQLAVRDTKVNKLTEDVANYKDASINMSSLITKNKETESEKIKILNEDVLAQQTKNKILENKNSMLGNRIKEVNSINTKLNESLAEKNASIKTLNESIDSLKESYEAKISKLEEAFKIKNSKLESELSKTKSELTKVTNLSESYKSLANGTVKSYIKSKALMLGVTENEIINKLGSKYSIEDIDNICESLKEETLNINSLPFSISKNSKISIKESKEPLLNQLSGKSSFKNELDDDSYLNDFIDRIK